MKWSIAVLVPWISACASPDTAVDAGPPSPVQAPAREWVTASAATEAVVLEMPARVVPSPRSSAVVTAPLRARIISVRVQAGDRVDAGAALLEVVMPELLEAAGRLVGAQARLAAWSERRAQLAQLKAEGLSRSPEVFEAQAKEAEARADLQAARASLLGAGFREGDAPALLSGSGVTALRAPIAGVVTEVRASPGESKEPGSGPLVSVAGEGPVRVEARFPRPAPEGGYAFVSATGETPLALVSRAPSADPRDGAFVVWLEPLPEARLQAGTLGRVTVDARGMADVVTVPARALRRAEGSSTVTTEQQAVQVDILRCGETQCLVRGPLRAGERLAIEEGR